MDFLDRKFISPFPFQILPIRLIHPFPSQRILSLLRGAAPLRPCVQRSLPPKKGFVVFFFYVPFHFGTFPPLPALIRSFKKRFSISLFPPLVIFPPPRWRKVSPIEGIIVPLLVEESLPIFMEISAWYFFLSFPRPGPMRSLEVFPVPDFYFELSSTPHSPSPQVSTPFFKSFPSFWA